MNEGFARLLPEPASTQASRIDALFYFLCAISIVVAFGIVALIFYFAVRYRQQGEVRVPMRGIGIAAADMRRIETLWIAAPLVVFMAIFYWGARLFAASQTPPADAIPVYVVGKQWMWKVQHPSGRREIDELHVPVGQAVKLVVTSEDVIHSFFVPAFRVKQDVLPGRYTTLWFEATAVGEYHLFCAEYCGTKHSQMIGRVVVMEPRNFQTWLSPGSDVPMSVAGRELYESLGCGQALCHGPEGKGGPQAKAPPLAGVFGTFVKLQAGDPVLADESYLRESILEPNKRIVAGYTSAMPAFPTLDEERVNQLVAYLRTLEPAPAAANAGPPHESQGGAEPVDAGPELEIEAPDATAEPDAGATP